MALNYQSSSLPYSWEIANLSILYLHGNKIDIEHSISSWKYNIRRNVNTDFSILTKRSVSTIFFEMGVVKNAIAINHKTLYDYFFL